LDGIIDTVSEPHDQQAEVDLLDVGGKLVVVGVPPDASLGITQFSLIFKRISVGGSLVGGIPETQEMLEFCAEKNVLPQVSTLDPALPYLPHLPTR
jgi:alcohol dehydrogenase (NADP+)